MLFATEVHEDTEDVLILKTVIFSVDSVLSVAKRSLLF